MEKTYSQKVARVFEIVDYILLLPAGLGVLLATLIPSLGTLLVYAVAIIGVILLVGYYKHSRGRLDESYLSALWITTAVYNFLLFLPWLYYCSVLLQESNFRGYHGDGALLSFLFALGMVLGYIAAITFSLKAYSFEKRKKLI